jgi:hypothetical protein
MHSIFIGLDLGQSVDATALAVVEEPLYHPFSATWVSYGALTLEERDQYPAVARRWAALAPALPPLWLRLLKRYALGTPYQAICTDVIRLLGYPTIKRREDAVLVVDGTGVGAPVVDIFRYSALPCDLYSVIITGGNTSEFNHITKVDLIGATIAVLQSGRLRVTDATEETETWAKEMSNYKFALTDAKNLTYNAREGKHDDLVLAVALAVYKRTRENRGE